jgi:hypothetical protein
MAFQDHVKNGSHAIQQTKKIVERKSNQTQNFSDWETTEHGITQRDILRLLLFIIWGDQGPQSHTQKESLELVILLSVQ